MNDPFTDYLLKLAVEKATLVRFLLLVRQWSEYFFFQSSEKSHAVSLTDFESSKTLSPIEQQLLATFTKQVLPGLTKQTFYKRFEQLEKLINAIPVIMLTLPCSLSSDSIEDFGKVIRSYIGSSFSIETRIDPSLVGGCAISWQGRYFEHCFASEFNLHRKQIQLLLGKNP